MDSLNRAAHSAAREPGLLESASVRPARLTPSVTVCICLDARVGGTAADFIDVPVADAYAAVRQSRTPLGVPRIPEPPQSAPSAFAELVCRSIQPVQQRLSNEVRQLGALASAADDYASPTVRRLPAPADPRSDESAR